MSEQSRLTLHQPVDAWYTIDVPGFDRLEFSLASDIRLALPRAVTYRGEFGGQLQSADQALAFRHAANGENHANDYQITRTGTFRFVRNDRILVAVDDAPDPTLNLLLGRAQEGYDLHRAGKEWLLSIDDPIVKATIERATVAGRVYEAPDTSEWSDLPLDGTYSQEASVRAIIPKTAASNEKWLREQGLSTKGSVIDLSAMDCIKAGLRSTTVLARCIGVGGGGGRSTYLLGLHANDRLNLDCRARRVREKVHAK